MWKLVEWIYFIFTFKMHIFHLYFDMWFQYMQKSTWKYFPFWQENDENKDDEKWILYHSMGSKKLQCKQAEPSLNKQKASLDRKMMLYIGLQWE